MSKHDAIHQLQTLWDAYQELRQAELKRACYRPQGDYTCAMEVPPFPDKRWNKSNATSLADTIDHFAPDAIEKAGGQYDRRYRPRKPAAPTSTYLAPDKEPLEKTPLGCTLDAIAAFALFVSLSCVVLAQRGAGYTITIGICAAYLVWRYVVRSLYARSKYAQQCAAARKNHKESMAKKDAKYRQKLQEYQRKCEEYEAERAQFLEDYAAWRPIYLEYIEKYRAAEARYDRDRQAGQAVKMILLQSKGAFPWKQAT